jgi:CHAT domain-containing protein
VTDGAAAAAAAEFYGALEHHGYRTDRVAHALNEAITALRRRHPDRPYDWLAYIHLGP